VVFPVMMWRGQSWACSSYRCLRSKWNRTIGAGAWSLHRALGESPVWAACVVVAIFALFHGYAHGKELPLQGSRLYSAGFRPCHGLLHVAGICLGLLKRASARHRGDGSMGGISGMGVWFLYRAIGHMRGGVVPPALLFLALGLALAFPRAVLGAKLACLLATPGAGAFVPVPQAWLEGVFLAFWVSVIVTAGERTSRSRDLDRGLPLPCRSTLLSGRALWSPCRI